MVEFPAMIEYLGASMTKPRAFVKIVLAERKALTFSFAIVAIVSAMIGLVTTHTLVVKPLRLIPINIIHVVSLSVIILSIVVSIFLGLISWLFIGFINYLILRGFGGKASFEETLTALTCFYTPYFIVGILSILTMYTGLVVGTLIIIVGLSIAFIWGLISCSSALSEVHKVSTLKAFLSIILTFIVITIALWGIPIVLALT